MMKNLNRKQTLGIGRLNQRFIYMVGGGAVVEQFHLPALKNLGIDASAIVIEPNRTQASKLKKKFNQTKIFSLSLEEYIGVYGALKTDSLAIVSVPNYLHVRTVELLLKSKIHVMCEKPLAMDSESCLRLEMTAKQEGVQLCVGMVRRLIPGILALKKELAENSVGKITGISIEDGCPYSWVSESGSVFDVRNGGVLSDMGSHYLDLLTYLFGENIMPVRYQDNSAGGVETDLIYDLSVNDSIPVNLKLSWIRNLKNRVLIEGEKGRLILEKDNFEYCIKSLKSKNKTERVLFEKPFASGNLDFVFESCFTEQIYRFINQINHQVIQLPSAADASKVCGIIQWAYQKKHDLEKKDRIQIRQIKHKTSVAVTGGTGFIGSHLIERIYRDGNSRVIVPVRSHRTAFNIAKFPVELKKYDLLNYQSTKDALSDCDVVYHLAYGASGNNASSVTIQGTKNVVEAAIENKAKCVLILSSMWVFDRTSKNGIISEDTAYSQSGTEYIRSKILMEKYCLERSTSSGGTKIIVLNPSCVYGPMGRAYTKIPWDLS
ncbi:MAG: NAD-dependent epimerase/dehydratase family protein, partial [Candidatus Omnitrophica bacterium]|nr:NAD-dependent epimerase/dehydratase family protein [Candidatus Omnitrophota bacterium]